MANSRRSRQAVDPNEGFDEFFQPNYEGRRRRGFTIFMTVIVVLLVLFVIAAVVAELAVRSYAEDRAEKEIESSLPAGTTGKVDVKIHGISVILQALSGHLDDVTLTSENLVVQKVPLRFTADLTRVPLQAGAKTGPVTATLKVDEKALNETKVVSDVGGAISLGRGDFSFDKSISILGVALKAKVVAKPTISSDGKTLMVSPTGGSISTPNSTIDASALLGYLKTLKINICAARYLPEGAVVKGVSIDPDEVTVDFRSPGLPLSSAGLKTTGTCS